ncbi:hypothetical protein HYH03_006332 [Edaphochlamys debaryana]|uniref:Uncharacterized protein n=1 Tax=Edaphochlamys debaryana TaxID=47281 RepID=A0A835Y5W5_9CHLO|nr:hypothetical protein HYH03_006332 [Edaphochlamys debaryana]|eukprot:KAG2495734.1 hypothetical protein HYH03_006332 [Edaphochlamys debaryana]
MTWTDEVHENRLQAAIVRASAERKLRKRGLPVPVMPTSNTGPVVAMVALASGLVAWQRWGGFVRSQVFGHPLARQLRTLIFGVGSSAAPRQVATTKSGSAGSSKASSKITARKAQVSVTPAQAAAAAAEARMTSAAGASTSSASSAAASSSSRPAQAPAKQPQASTSAPSPAPPPAEPASTSSSAAAKPSSSGGGGGGSKKKSGKKRR